MRKEILCMNRFVNGILMLLWAAGTVVMAQTPTRTHGHNREAVGSPKESDHDQN
jgi:hypothetical protein